MKLEPGFYRRRTVTKIARELLGKILVSRLSGEKKSGIIVETEAYSFREKGCHAFENKRTARNLSMFQEGGVVYIYQCYGIHHLLNVVTGDKDEAEAVLIRALQPLSYNAEPPKERRHWAGPGRLTRSLGILTRFDGLPLSGNKIWIEEGKKVSPRMITSGPRIGIDYAGKDAKLPWRFWLRDNPWVSR